MLRSYFQAFFYDQDHSYLRQSRRRKSRSFVQAFLKLHYVWFQDLTNISITDIDGANATAPVGSSFNLRCTNAGRGGSSHGYPATTTGRWLKSTESGIVVGTGTTTVTPQDYSLATQVLEGITAGTLEHLSSSGTGLTISNPTGSFTLDRLFRNSSGGSITLNEVGVYAVMGSAKTVGGITQWQPTAIIRDLVSPGFAVANGEYMRIIYTITVTV